MNVYYFHDVENVTSELPAMDIQQLKKTFTRTVVYRGTKDGGKSYQSVNGSPDGKNTYVQTITFTRSALVDKVTHKVVGYTPWESETPSFAAVPSTDPHQLGYGDVDIRTVDSFKVDPSSNKTDLGTTVVTYKLEDQPTNKPGQPSTNPDRTTVDPTNPKPNSDRPTTNEAYGSLTSIAASTSTGQDTNQKTPNSKATDFISSSTNGAEKLATATGATSNKQSLPQTGDEQANLLSVLGLTSLTAILGFGGLKKRRHN